jgi:hypothetical protein
MPAYQDQQGLALPSWQMASWQFNTLVRPPYSQLSIVTDDYYIVECDVTKVGDVAWVDSIADKCIEYIAQHHNNQQPACLLIEL